MPFISHLEELRSRLLRVIIAVGVLFVICYFFKKKLFEILTIPLAVAMPENGTMIFTNLPEAFFTYLKVAFFGAIFLASPYIFYQIWKFVSPGLLKSEKKYVFPFIFFSVTFFMGGSAFAYYVVFPFGFKFFLAFSTDFIKPMLSIKEYLSFSFKLLLAFGIIFELPIFMFFLSMAGVVDSKMLTTKRRYAILLIFVIAALFTPPDIVTQVLMALPLMLLYEVSVWVVKLGEKKASEKEVSENET